MTDGMDTGSGNGRLTMRTLALPAALAVVVAACEPTFQTASPPDDEEWVTALADMMLSHLGADYDGRPAVLTEVRPGLERFADALARVPGAVDAADRPRRVPMTPEALAGAQQREANHPPRATRDAITMSAEDVETILGWIGKAEMEGILAPAEAERRRRRLIGPVGPRAALLNVESGSWRLTLIEIVTDEADHKEANFLFAHDREVERNRPMPYRTTYPGVSDYGIEALWRNGAWVVGEIGRTRGPIVSGTFRGVALPAEESWGPR